MNGDFKKKLPIGEEDFKFIRQQGFFYIDKTLLIRDLLNGSGKVNLFTRPRRFGKTLNMSMLREFFDINGDQSVFEGLAIMNEKAMCEEYMGKFPVVFVSLKGIDAPTYADAYDLIRNMIRETCSKYSFLLDSDKINISDKNAFNKIYQGEPSRADIIYSLKLLTSMLYSHYGKKVIVLIDEYDVPLDKANRNKYYEDMIALIRSMFNEVLKTNDYLHFAVLTGCLRISKESIFTGLNNPKIFSITDAKFDEYFGFTEDEVAGILEYYGLQSFSGAVKEWYDGYRFGQQDIYCPWDVINYCYDVLENDITEPQTYWINTSSNDLVRSLINETKTGTERMEIEQLIAGETINKSVNDKLTYTDVNKNINNLWSILFMTGYLTMKERPSGGLYKLVIPNKEVRQIFNEKVLQWFNDRMYAQANKLTDLYTAFANGDTKKIEEIVNIQLFNTISYHDEYESFYHGFLLALLGTCADWRVDSNRENGLGRSDISVESFDGKLGIVIEIKLAKNGKFAEACAEALQQIEDRDYTSNFRQFGIEHILAYGIAFYGKRCYVEVKKLS